MSREVLVLFIKHINALVASNLKVQSVQLFLKVIKNKSVLAFHPLVDLLSLSNLIFISNYIQVGAS